MYFNLVPWQTCSQQGYKVMPWHISTIIIWPKQLRCQVSVLLPHSSSWFEISDNSYRHGLEAASVLDQIHSDGDQSDKWKDRVLDQERPQNSSSTHGSRLILPSTDLCPFAGVFVKPEGMAMLAQDSSSAFCGCASGCASDCGVRR